MADVKWIKIVTDIFDDEKIRYIETLPEGDTIALLWFRIMCLAGKSNCGGFLMMTDRIPYTEDMLASIFNRDIKIIRLCLQTFEAISMIEIIDNRLYLTNWEKHQNAEAMDKIREQTRLRTQLYRERLIEGERHTASQHRHMTVTVTQQSKNKKEDIDKEEDIDKSTLPAKAVKPPKSDIKSKYGLYSNVLLTDKELETLKSEFTDWNNRIDRLSEYIESKGTKYKSHLATIRAWARKDKDGQDSRNTGTNVNKTSKWSHLSDAF